MALEWALACYAAMIKETYTDDKGNFMIGEHPAWIVDGDLTDSILYVLHPERLDDDGKPLVIVEVSITHPERRAHIELFNHLTGLMPQDAFIGGAVCVMQQVVDFLHLIGMCIITLNDQSMWPIPDGNGLHLVDLRSANVCAGRPHTVYMTDGYGFKPIDHIAYTEMMQTVMTRVGSYPAKLLKTLLGQLIALKALGKKGEKGAFKALQSMSRLFETLTGKPKFPVHLMHAGSKRKRDNGVVQEVQKLNGFFWQSVPPWVVCAYETFRRIERFFNDPGPALPLSNKIHTFLSPRTNAANYHILKWLCVRFGVNLPVLLHQGDEMGSCEAGEHYIAVMLPTHFCFICTTGCTTVKLPTTAEAVTIPIESNVCTFEITHFPVAHKFTLKLGDKHGNKTEYCVRFEHKKLCFQLK